MYAMVEWILEGLFSVISLTAITSPRKEFTEYKPGDEVEAKFQGKIYPAKLVTIGENKKDLEKGLNATRSSTKAKSQGTPAASSSTSKTVQQRKHVEVEPSSSPVCANIPDAATIDAHIHRFFAKNVLSTSTQEETPQPATATKTLQPAPMNSPQPVATKKTPELHKRFQSSEFVDSSSSDISDDDTGVSATVLTPLVNIPMKVPRQQLPKDSSPCRREECIRAKEELSMLREQAGVLEAANRKLTRNNKDLELKCSSTVIEAANGTDGKLKPGIVSDRSAAREHKMVELVRGSYVYLYEKQLKLATESSKSMTSLARHLVDVFYSIHEQKTANLTGTNGLKALDKTIVEAIITYSVSCDSFKRQSPAEIKQSLRNKLGCLRAPSRKKAD